jgi:protein TonB
MRRRRKKNTLLTRIILISIGVHAIALPIAAHYGALDKLKKDFGVAQVMVVNVPPLEEKKEVAKKEKKPKKSESTAKKGPNTAHHAARANSKPNPFQPKVEAAATPGDDSGEGLSVDANGTGKAGVLPSSGAPVAKTPAATTPEHTSPVASTPVTPTPQPKPEAPVASTPTPVEKKFVQVETTYAPDPVIPDDLRTEPLDKTLVVEADVSTGGEPQNVKVAESTGNRELDDVGLDTARHYKFKPATLGDEPVVGHVRFRIIFKVE